MARNLAGRFRLLAVTDDAVLDRADPVAACVAACRGGATVVQLRLKRASPRELLALARALKAALPVPLLVNDRLDVALAAGAAGVHLGPEDLPVARARAIAPDGFLIGASVGSEAEARAGRAEQADYWGVGPWRRTTTKADAGEPLGPEAFQAIVALAGGRPCVAIGGVRPEDVPAIRAAGGAGVAVVSGIFGAAEVEAAARRYSGER